MKISTLDKKGIGPYVIDTISLLIDRMPWPSRRQAMAEVTQRLLDGKPRVAEDAFGWSRTTVTLGMNELRSGIICRNDLTQRRKPKTEEKYPQLIDDIHELMAPECQADPHLRTTLAYTNKTAAAVCSALVEKGWSPEIIPSVRTMSDILMRLGYRLTEVSRFFSRPCPGGFRWSDICHRASIRKE